MDGARKALYSPPPHGGTPTSPASPSAKQTRYRGIYQKLTTKESGRIHSPSSSNSSNSGWRAVSRGGSQFPGSHTASRRPGSAAHFHGMGQSQHAEDARLKERNFKLTLENQQLKEQLQKQKAAAADKERRITELTRHIHSIVQHLLTTQVAMGLEFPNRPADSQTHVWARASRWLTNKCCVLQELYLLDGGVGDMTLSEEEGVDQSQWQSIALHGDDATCVTDFNDDFDCEPNPKAVRTPPLEASSIYVQKLKSFSTRLVDALNGLLRDFQVKARIQLPTARTADVENGKPNALLDAHLMVLSMVTDNVTECVETVGTHMLSNSVQKTQAKIAEMQLEGTILHKDILEIAHRLEMALLNRAATPPQVPRPTSSTPHQPPSVPYPVGGRSPKAGRPVKADQSASSNFRQHDHSSFSSISSSGSVGWSVACPTCSQPIGCANCAPDGPPASPPSGRPVPMSRPLTSSSQVSSPTEEPTSGFTQRDMSYHNVVQAVVRVHTALGKEEPALAAWLAASRKMVQEKVKATMRQVVRAAKLRVRGKMHQMMPLEVDRVSLQQWADYQQVVLDSLAQRSKASSEICTLLKEIAAREIVIPTPTPHRPGSQPPSRTTPTEPSTLRSSASYQSSRAAARDMEVVDSPTAGGQDSPHTVPTRSLLSSSPVSSSGGFPLGFKSLANSGSSSALRHSIQGPIRAVGSPRRVDMPVGRSSIGSPALRLGLGDPGELGSSTNSLGSVLLQMEDDGVALRASPFQASSLGLGTGGTPRTPGSQATRPSRLPPMRGVAPTSPGQRQTSQVSSSASTGSFDFRPESPEA